MTPKTIDRRNKAKQDKLQNLAGAKRGFTRWQADCGDIREACKGLGTSDSRLVSILCGRTKPHLARVDYYYHSLYGMSLEAQIKDECSGVYR